MLGKFEELMVILVIVLVLFGGKKIPELARGIGQAAREVRKGFAGEPTDDPKASNKDEAAAKPAAVSTDQKSS